MKVKERHRQIHDVVHAAFLRLSRTQPPLSRLYRRAAGAELAQLN